MEEEFQLCRIRLASVFTFRPADEWERSAQVIYGFVKSQNFLSIMCGFRQRARVECALSWDGDNVFIAKTKRKKFKASVALVLSYKTTMTARPWFEASNFFRFFFRGEHIYIQFRMFVFHHFFGCWGFFSSIVVVVERKKFVFRRKKNRQSFVTRGSIRRDVIKSHPCT